MPGITVINVGKKRRVPFVVKDHSGAVDITSPVTLGTTSSDNVTVTIDPEDPRSMILEALAPTPSGNVTITVTAFDHSDTIGVFVPTPPDGASVTIGVPGDEF